MELALNFAWFLITVASYGLLIWRFASREAGCSGTPSRCQCVVALSCALAILFPVISLTDDLHEMQATVEDSSASPIIMKKCGVDQQLSPVRTPHQMFYIVSSFWTDFAWLVFGSMASQRTVQVLPRPWLTTLGRAPPSFVILAIS